MQDVGRGPVGLDTAAFIYWMEEHRVFLPAMEPIFRAIAEGRLEGVTSGVTLLETLVVPLRAGDRDLADRYETCLTRARGIRLVDLDRPLLRAAAELRATLRVKTPDALQLAAALRFRCTTFVTNDRRLPAVPGLAILQLRDYARD